MPLKYPRDSRVICELGCFDGKTSAALAKKQGRSVCDEPFFRGHWGFPYGEVGRGRAVSTNVVGVAVCCWIRESITGTDY
jgi:hypothetical protein